MSLRASSVQGPMHFRRLRLVTVLLVVRGAVRLAPLVGCAVLAARLRSAAAPVATTPSDPTPAPITSQTETASPLTRAAPAVDALTTAIVFDEVQMVTSSVGWAWTQDGTFARTADGGRTWVAVGPTGCAHFASGPLHAWVATCDTPGGRVHFTADGGQTWSYASAVTSNERSPITARSLEFVDASHGFVELVYGVEGEEASSYRTSDGGRTWRELGGSPWDATTTFVDARHGWRSASHALERSTDGGETWTPHVDLVACAVDMVPSFEGATGIVVGNCPPGLHVFHTSDGGERWVPGPKVALSDPGVAVHGGAQAMLWSSGQGLVSTTDGGRSFATSSDSVPMWSTFQLVAPSRGFEMQQLDDDLVVSRTTDGGRTFSTALTTPLPPLRGVHPLAWGLSFSDADHGVCFTSFDTGTRVISTSDGGTSWRFVRH